MVGGGRNRVRPKPRSPWRLGLIGGLALLLAGCGGLGAPPAAPSSGDPGETPTPRPSSEPTASVPLEPCAGGRLTVGDLRAIDEARTDGVAAAAERARRWRSDARLVSLRVACQPLESGFRWQGRYYAESAQSFYFSDTGETEPAEVDPDRVPTLPSDELSFRELQISLARAGNDDAAELSATGGVTVRLNVPVDPFGPPGMPEGVVYHVAIPDQGDVRDLFVSGSDWTIHRYQP